MSLKKLSAKSVMWASSTSVINQLVNLLVYIILARLLSLEEFGLVLFAFLLIEFASIFTNVGINQNLIRRKEWSDRFASSSHSLLILMSLTITLLLIFCVAPITGYVHSKKAALLIILLSIVPMIHASQMAQLAKLQREFKNKKIAFSETLGIFAGAIVSITLALLEFGAWALAVGKLVQCLVTAFLIKKHSDFTPSYRIEKSDVKEILDFGVPMFFIASLSFLSNKVSDILIGLIFGTTTFAFISFAKRIFLVFQQLIFFPIGKVLNATIPRVEKNNIPHVFYRLIKITSFLVLPAYLGVGAIAEPFVLLAVDEKWFPVIEIMKLLSFVIPAIIFGFFLPTLLISQGLSKVALQLNLITLITNVFLPLLTFQFGILAVVAASVAANYLTLHLRFSIVKKHININFVQTVLSAYPFILSGFFMYYSIQFLSFYLVGYSHFTGLIVSIIVGIVSYVLFLITFFRRQFFDTLEELRSFTSSLN